MRNKIVSTDFGKSRYEKKKDAYFEMIHDDTSAENISIHTNEVRQVGIDYYTKRSRTATEGPNTHVRVLKYNMKLYL